MTRIARRTLPILLCTLAGAGSAMTPDDFARGREVLPDAGLVQRVIVPEDVYRWTTRADLGDLRVLDASGNPAPFAVRVPQPAPPPPDWQPLPWFVLPAPGGTTGLPASVNVQLGADGTVIAVHGPAAAAAGRAAYLLDAGTSAARLAVLRMHWAGDAADFVARVRLEDSDDLHDWHTLVPSATLAQVGSGPARIVADRVALPRSPRRYLRLGGMDDAPLPPLTAMDAAQHQPVAPLRHRTRLPALTDGRRAAETREYDTGGHFPVDQARLVPGESTYRAVVRLFSRNAADAPWRDQGRHTVYAFAAVAGGETAAAASSDPIALPAVTDRFWRVDWLVREGIADPSAVMLEIAWQPHEVVFLRQGLGTHLVAYGRSGLEPGAWPMAELSERLDGASLDGLAPRPLGEPMAFGGASRLEPPPPTRDWRTMILWAVLLAGVALVAGLAYRLLR